MPETAPYTKPQRYTADDLEFVTSSNIGGPREPDGANVVSHIKGTDIYFMLQTNREKECYNIQNARRCTEDGVLLTGKAGELPEPVRRLLVAVWGHKACPDNTPLING